MPAALHGIIGHSTVMRELTTLADFDRVFAVNVRGAFVATQAALKHIKSGGRIIMIGSCVGERVFIPGMD